MAIKAVIFDFGNVLSLPQDQELFAQIAQKCAVSFDTLNQHYWDLRDGYDRGDYGGVDYWRQIAARSGIEIDDVLMQEILELDNLSWARENEGLSAFARAAREAGLQTAILSNMPHDFRNWLSTGVKWLPSFDHHTYSCEVGAVKPDIRIYEHCLSGLNAAPEQALFIDDRQVNIDAARTLGIQGVLFTDTERTLAQCQKLCGVKVAV